MFMTTTHPDLDADILPPELRVVVELFASELAKVITTSSFERAADGTIRAPEAPGLGFDVDLDAVGPYLHEVEILLDGERLYGDRRTVGAAS